jgi:hypothetical protein
MARPCNLRPEDVPIPRDVKAHPKWPPMMLEMAAHIGAYATLLIVEAFAGQDVYVPRNPSTSPFVDIVGRDKAEILSHVYGCEKLPIPTGRNALLHARRQTVIAAIRAGTMGVGEGAALMRMRRSHMSHLVNKTREGTSAEPVALLIRPRDTRQLELFGDFPLCDSDKIAIEANIRL